MTGTDVAPLLPEACLASGLVAILAADLARPAGSRGRGVAAGIGAIAAGAALVATAAGQPAVGRLVAVGDMLAIDGITALARPAILIAIALVLIAGRGEHGDEADHGAWAASVTGLGLGALVPPAASNMVTLWLGLELVSLASYVLAAWRARDRGAAEAGMKFTLFGGVASGLMLFGISHVYGLTGHLDFAGIGAALSGNQPIAAVAALCLAGVGIAYKLAIVPFHFYAPDVYQGAPALTVAAVSVTPKIAAAAALGRGLDAAVPPTLVPPASLGSALTAAAVASLLVASFTALAQRDAKRIVAFSGIGHAGAVLLALACVPGPGAIAAAAFYLAAYALANIGALVCLAVLERERGSCALDALAGAVRRRPWLTAALCLFLFSLAGVPPLAGFLAKWGVLREALRLGLDQAGRAHLAWAALALLVTTAISAWSYLLIVRAAVLVPAPPAPPAPTGRDLRLASSTTAVLLFCAAGTIAAGLWLDGFAVIGRAVSAGRLAW